MRKNRMKCLSCNGTQKVQMEEEIFTAYGSYLEYGEIIGCPDCEDGTWDKMKYARSWIGLMKGLEED